MIHFKTKYLRHLIVILLGAFLFSVPSFAALKLDIDSTGTWPYVKRDVNFGSLYPAEFKEDETVITPDGSYSNRAIMQNNQHGSTGYTKFQFMISGSLNSGPNTIPIDRLGYIFTWSNGYGTKYNYSIPRYMPIPTSYTDLYSSEAQDETIGVWPDNGIVEVQLKYSIQIPDDQPPGTYTGATIDYNMYDPDGTPTITPQSVNVSVTVLPMLQLSIDRGTIDFEDMLPGQERENIPVEGIIVTTKTNTGNPWYLKISNDSPLTSGPAIIPNSNFYWYGWTDGMGRWRGTGEDTLSLTPKLVYSSGPGETNNLPDGTLNHFKFKLKIPTNQKPGKYLSTVRLTITE